MKNVFDSISIFFVMTLNKVLCYKVDHSLPGWLLIAGHIKPLLIGQIQPLFQK
jgi:hypothetical protein